MALTDAERAIIARIADLPHEDVCPSCGNGYIDPSPWSKSGFCVQCTMRREGTGNFPDEVHPPASGRVVRPRQVWRSLSASIRNGRAS